jgi:hypothetical protein
MPGVHTSMLSTNLAIVGGIDAGQKLAIAIDQLRNLVQKRTAIGRPKFGPGTFKSTTSSRDSLVNIGGGSSLESDDLLFSTMSTSSVIRPGSFAFSYDDIRGVDDRDAFARSSNKFVIDEQASWLAVFPAIRQGKLNRGRHDKKLGARDSYAMLFSGSGSKKRRLKTWSICATF